MTNARLIRDDPSWPMPSLTRMPSLRRLRVWVNDALPRGELGAFMAVVTESEDSNTSVTNVAERVREVLAREYPGVRVFEHYPAEVGVDAEEHFDEITVDPSGAPRWSRWPAAVMAEWLGPGVLLKPLAD